jgi:hypothetical protein
MNTLAGCNVKIAAWTRWHRPRLAICGRPGRDVLLLHCREMDGLTLAGAVLTCSAGIIATYHGKRHS